MWFFDLFTQKIGIDLGTSNTLVYVSNNGITVNEPSVVAIRIRSNEVCAVGQDAKLMLDRTPKAIKAIRPLQNGVIADFDVTRAMVKYFIDKSLNKRKFVKSDVVICVPVGVTSIEKRAVEEVAYDSGARRVKLVEEPMAAAIGANIDVDKPVGNMIVDIGGGTTEIAVISLGGIVTSDSLRIAGDDMDVSVKDYIKSKYKMEIGLVTAEKIKTTIGNASKEFYDINHHTKIEKNDNEKDGKDEKGNDDKENEGKKEVDEYKKDEQEYPEQMQIRGRDIVSGLPLNIIVTNDEIREAIMETISSILSAIKRVLEKTPPELSSDIYSNGIYLTGGGALLKGLDMFIEKETGLKVFIAEKPLDSVVLGAGKICETM
jgi:rod shape-determining protein MreB